MSRERLVCSGCGLDPWTSAAHDGFGRCHGNAYERGRVAGLREAADLADQRADLSSDLAEVTYMGAFAVAIRARAGGVDR